MYSSCIICGGCVVDRELNGLELKQCSICGLAWRKDFNLASDYYKDKENNLDKAKLIERTSNCFNRFEMLKSLVGFDNLCDIGCGEGIFLKILKEKCYKNTFGIEPNSKFIDFAVRGGISVINGGVEDFPNFSTGVRTVTMFHVIEHLSDPASILNMIYNNLEIGSRLVIETPNFDSYSFRRSNYNNKLIYKEHLFYFNEGNLQKLLEKIGFKIIARGRRDFNQNHLSIKEIIYRLGFPRNTHRFFLHAVKIIKKLLNWIVIKTGRLDYIWIVAER